MRSLLPRSKRDDGLSSQVLRRLMPLAICAVAAFWLAVSYMQREQFVDGMKAGLTRSLTASANILAVHIDNAVASARSAAQNAIAIGALFGQDIDRVARPYLKSLIIGSEKVTHAAIYDFRGVEIVSTESDQFWAREAIAEGWVDRALEGTETVELRGNTFYAAIPILLSTAPEGVLLLAIPRDNLISGLADRAHADVSFSIVRTDQRSRGPIIAVDDTALRGIVTSPVYSAPRVSAMAVNTIPLPSISSDPVQAALLMVFLLVLGLVMLGIWIAVRLLTAPISALIRRLEDNGLEIGALPESAPREIRTLADRFRVAGEEIADALRQERELTAQQRQFVSMVSHEFRTPLAIIDGNAQSIERNRKRMNDEQIDSKVKKTRNAVRRLIRLMESTLIASKLEAGTIVINRGQVKLKSMLGSMIEELKAVKSGVAIEMDLEDCPEELSADETLLYSVIDNLISNAIKYAPSNPAIQIKTKVVDGFVTISVTDNGVGIPPDEIDKIGTRYFRASTSTGIAGTGIGLNMVNMVVTLHGGDMGLTSQVGVGSTFSVRIPVAPPTGSDVSEAEADRRLMADQTTQDDLSCLVYCSRATGALSERGMSTLMEKSRARNFADGITGCLLAHDGFFLQVIEGPGARVRDTFARIENDPRHQDLTLLFEGQIKARSFPDWSMGSASLRRLRKTNPGLMTRIEEEILRVDLPELARFLTASAKSDRAA